MQLVTSASFAQLVSQQAKTDDNAMADGQTHGLVVKRCAAHASGQTHKCRVTSGTRYCAAILHLHP